MHMVAFFVGHWSFGRPLAYFLRYTQLHTVHIRSANVVLRYCARTSPFVVGKHTE